MDEDVIKPVKKTEKQIEKKDTVILVFKQNRKFELCVNRIVYFFEGKIPVEVPKSVIQSEQFKQQEKYFIIKEL